MTILHHLPARTATVGDFAVRRLLPKAACRKVGPWVFLDHFGPHEGVRTREGDVRPHPHCALSTVSLSSSDNSSIPKMAMISCNSLYRCKVNFTRCAQL